MGGWRDERTNPIDSIDITAGIDQQFGDLNPRVTDSNFKQGISNLSKITGEGRNVATLDLADITLVYKIFTLASIQESSKIIQAIIVNVMGSFSIE